MRLSQTILRRPKFTGLNDARLYQGTLNSVRSHGAELDRVRRAVKGDSSGLEHSQISRQLTRFSLAELLFYEDRVTAGWG